MKNALKSFWSILCELGRARHAAEMARNGKIKQAQNYFGKTVGL